LHESDGRKPCPVRRKELRAGPCPCPESLFGEEQTGAQSAEKRRKELIVWRRAGRKARTRLGLWGAAGPIGTAETELLAVHIYCTLERTCLLGLDASETRLHIPSHCITTPLSIFPIPSPNIFGLAQPRWAL